MNEIGKNSGNLTLIPFGLPGGVYRAPLPFGDFDEQESTLQEMKNAGVELVYCLVEEIEWWEKSGVDLPAVYAQAGLQMVHYPVVDFEAPEDPKTYKETVLQALAYARFGKIIAVHCNAGIGRTGTFLALMAMLAFEWPTLTAVAWLRRYIPSAVENEKQLKFLIDIL